MLSDGMRTLLQAFGQWSPCVLMLIESCLFHGATEQPEQRGDIPE